MATYQDLIPDVSFIADVDMTTLQYRMVSVASTVGKVASATGASNPLPIGVLQNSPSAGQEARVRIFGISKIVAKTDGSCGMAYGRIFSASAGGQAWSSGSESAQVFGMWLDANLAVSTSAIGRAFINFGTFAGSAAAAS